MVFSMKRMGCAALFVAIMAMPVLAQYTVPRSVFGNGAAKISSATTSVRGTVGQAAIGILHELSGQQQQVGFWYMPGNDVEPINDAGQYSLLAVHSLKLNNKSELHSGFAGVNELAGEEPFLDKKVPLSIGTQVVTSEEVELSGASMVVKNKAEIKGVLHYFDELDAHKKAEIAESIQEAADFWPLVELPTFRAAVPGNVDVDVKGKDEVTLAPQDGPFSDVKVKNKGRLIFSGGEYHMENLDIGNDVEVVFLAPTVLLIADKFSTGNKSSFGPADNAGISAADILVYVGGYNGKAKKKDDELTRDELLEESFRRKPQAVDVGVQSEFSANVYAPNGTLSLGQKSEVKGGFIARDVEVGVQAKVFLESGWENGSSVAPAPVAKAVARAALAQAVLPEGFALEQNFPNPFNPSTMIRYSLSEMADVKLSIYNMLGQEIRVLVRDARPAGIHHVEWDGRDAMGRHVATGLYFYRIEAGQFRSTRKMTLTK